MKKAILIAFVTLTVVACGSNNTVVVNQADSTQAQVDSSAVTAKDTTVAQIGAAKDTLQVVK